MIDILLNLYTKSGYVGPTMDGGFSAGQVSRTNDFRERTLIKEICEFLFSYHYVPLWKKDMKEDLRYRALHPYSKYACFSEVGPDDIDFCYMATRYMGAPDGACLTYRFKIATDQNKYSQRYFNKILYKDSECAISLLKVQYFPYNGWQLPIGPNLSPFQFKYEQEWGIEKEWRFVVEWSPSCNRIPPDRIMVEQKLRSDCDISIDLISHTRYEGNNLVRKHIPSGKEEIII